MLQEDVVLRPVVERDALASRIEVAFKALSFLARWSTEAGQRLLAEKLSHLRSVLASATDCELGSLLNAVRAQCRSVQVLTIPRNVDLGTPPAAPEAFVDDAATSADWWKTPRGRREFALFGCTSAYLRSTSFATAEATGTGATEPPATAQPAMEPCDAEVDRRVAWFAAGNGGGVCHPEQ